MTLRGLISRLKKLEKDIGPGATVVIELAEVKEITDDEVSHYALSRCGGERIRWRGRNDEWERKDGQERTRSVVVLAI